MNESDAALVEKCLQGQSEVFAELMQRHQEAVFGLAMSMTRYNYAEASDLAQETFIAAYRKLSYYDPQRAFHTWVMTICANLAKNRFRSRQRRHDLEEKYQTAQIASMPARSSPELLEEILRQIPDKLRIPLVLRHTEGLSYDEIAHILGIGVSAAKMRVKRGLDELAAKLRSEAA